MFTHVNIILTHKCNSKCYYCFVCADKFKKEEIEISKLLNSLLNFKKNGGISVLFTGGEPLIYSNLKTAFLNY